MMDKDNNNWYAMSDAALLELIGLFIKDCRLKQNKTQQDVAEAAGLNRSTIVLLEKGSGGTLSSLIQVLRTLEQLHLLEIFKVEQTLSPLQLAKLEQNRRQRASRTNSKK
jgi:transcriptional regulator with XRE-family HTH domain